MWRLMACGWWIVTVQKRLVDFHLGRVVVGPNYTGRFVVQRITGGKKSLLVICWRIGGVGDEIGSLLVVWWSVFIVG